MADRIECQILNINITATSVEDLAAFLRTQRQKKRGGKYVCNASVSDVMNSKKNETLKSFFDASEIIFPVSGQLVAEMHVQGYPVAKKINMDSFVDKVLSMSVDNGFKQLFVIDKKEDYSNIVDNTLDHYPGLLYDLTTVEDVLKKGAEYINGFDADYVWFVSDNLEMRKWLSSNASDISGYSIALSYGMIKQNGKLSSDGAKRIKPGYIGMNIRFLIETGGKIAVSTLSWAPALAMILTIFILSAQTGEVSNQASIKVANDMSRFSFMGMDLSYDQYMTMMDALNAIVRTLGHMGEYALLAIFTGLAITANGIRGKIRILYMFFIGSVVSIFDEILQFFVPERYCDIVDVITDCTSVLLVSFVFYYIGKIVSRLSKREYSYKGKRRKFLNMFIDDISFDEALGKISEYAKMHEKKYVVTPNADHAIKLEKDATFRQVYENADLIVTDGTPLMWIADSMNCPITEKIPGADMLPRVCEMAAKENLSVFLFGAADGVARKAADKLQKRYEGLNICGVYSPPMGFENEDTELEKAINAINEKKPDILVVGLGSPKQEKFIYKYRKRMEYGVALPFGAAIDFEAGNVKRAPKWMRRNGLEWFYRFLKEPGRLFRRYFVDDIKIFWLAWKYRYEIIRVTKRKEK